jgi:hypothetical protein
MAFKIIAVYGMVALAAYFAAQVVASLKRRNGNAWGLASFLVPPALLVLAFLPAIATPRLQKLTWDERERLEDLHEHGGR